MPDKGPVADDDGRSPVGVGVKTAFPAPEHRLALAVARAPVSAARAGLGRALRRNGDGRDAEFGGFLAQQLADVADGRFGEAFVQFSFGLHVLARAFACATGGCNHADGVQALDGHQLGLGCQQDVTDLPAHFLVAALSLATGLLPVLRNRVLPSFAVTGFAGGVALVLASALALLLGSRVVGPVSRAEGQVVLASPVGAEDVFRALDVQVLDKHGLRYRHLDMKEVVPAVQRRTRPVVLYRHEPYGADVQPFERVDAAQPDGEVALAAGEGLVVVAHLEKPPVGDGQAELAMLS